MVTSQATNLGELQCALVPDLSVDSNFNFVRMQRIGIILIEPDSTKSKRALGVEEKGAIGKRKLKSGVGGVLWAMRASMGMMRLVRMARLVRVVGFVGMTRLA